MNNDPFMSPRQLEREKVRFREDVEVALKAEKNPLVVVSADPMYKDIACSGEYSDYLLAKKIEAANGWNFKYSA